MDTPKQKSFANALKWAYTGNWGDRALSAIFIFVLAGILGPRDFGIAAIAATYVAFLQMFLDQGVAAALIQKKDLEREHLDAVFWMNIVVSLFLVFVSCLLGQWWAIKNHAPESAKLIMALSLTIIIEALSIVQTAILKKQMDFKSLAIRTNAAALISGVVGAGMAVAGFGVWALVGQQVLRDLIAVVLLWNLSSWRPRFSFSWLHLRDLMGFSVPNFLAQIAIFADVQAASIVLGLFFGPVAVGLYRLADRIVNSVIVIATTSIQSVSFPEFSRLQDDPLELRQSVLTCVRLSSAATLPALAGLIAVGSPLMAMLGAKWIPASDVLKVLAGLGMTVVLSFFTAPLLQALAKTRMVAVLEWGRMFAGVAILVAVGAAVSHAAVETQVMGIAVSRIFVGALLVMPIFVYILLRYSRASLWDLISSLFPSVISAVSVIVAVKVYDTFLGRFTSRPLVVVAAETLLGGAVGLLVLLALDKQLRQAITSIVRRYSGGSRSLAEASESLAFSGPLVPNRAPFSEAPLVSIIVRTYNRSYILAEALASALNQTYSNLEVVVVDDCSTDNTREVIESFHSDKIRYVRHSINRGVGAACNTGITAAHGDLIAFLDSDDLWKPNTLQRQVEFLMQHEEADAVFGDVELDEGPSITLSLTSLKRHFPSLLDRDRSRKDYVFHGRQMYLCLLEEIPIKPTALVLRRDVFPEVGLFNEAWRSGEDWEFLLRLSRSACFGYIDETLAILRRTPDATHRKYWEQDKAFLLSLFRREKAALAHDERAIQAVNRGISSHCTNLGGRYLEAGRRKDSVSVYLQGYRETGELMMLLRALSTVFPLRLRSMVRRSVRGVTLPEVP